MDWGANGERIWSSRWRGGLVAKISDARVRSRDAPQAPGTQL